MLCGCPCLSDGWQSLLGRQDAADDGAARLGRNDLQRAADQPGPITHDPQSKTIGVRPRGRKPGAVIFDAQHGAALDQGKFQPDGFRVAVADGIPAEVRLYDRLFTEPQPDAGGKDFLASLNPNSLKVVRAVVEPTLANARADDKFQFERHGYFVADRVDHAPGKPVFNLAVGLKDSWGK